MPKGKKKGGKKKKEEAKDGATKGDEEKKDFEVPSTSDKELNLQQELNELDYEMATLKKQVDELKLENEWLQEEAEKTRLENQDYQTYVSRRAQKRQSLVVSLGDQNRLELEEIKQQKQQLIDEFEKKKAELTATLFEKQNEFSRVNQELATLQPYRALQREQEEEIAALEKEVEEKRFQHETRIRALKTQFLKEQKSFEKEAELRVRTMAEKADKRASECLKEQSQKISVENRQLRSRLQQLIEKNNSLQVRKMQLEKQYHKLLEEQKFIHELQKIRGLSLSSSVGSTSELSLSASPEQTVGLPRLALTPMSR